MSIHRWKRTAALLPLLALLVAVLPTQQTTVSASPVRSLSNALLAREETAPLPAHLSDAELVRSTLQHPIQDDIFYFVLPDRFNNGDASNDVGADAGGTTPADVLRHGYLPTDKGYFHGGDLEGLQAKLDYLEQLGVTAIWMTPIFKNKPVQGDDTTINGSSAAYHGYWITDFTQVDLHLGTNAELSSLITDAHSRGMKVFFDIITNHTADVITYEENQFTYRNKTNFPYKDAAGAEFDDKTYAGTATFPELDPETSFPYTPVFRTPADATVKQPNWLNDRTNYHNRGDSTFSGESSEYGDFFGLDDLFTEQPDVVNGMIDIYKTWIDDFGIDGFRIDTVKHVNIEFWQRFGPEIMAYAQARGKTDFFMYGEVFSGDVPFVSTYTTEGRLPAALDFPFQGTARSFASQSGATNNLRELFAADDYYIDADSNAYSLPTFLGNHDMGRFGHFLNQDNAGATDAELLARDQLAHALMFFARGMPVVYYGDEQGFTGNGGDKDARQDMFPSQVADYNDDDLIGTTATAADDNFTPTHPLYQSIQALSDLRQSHQALRRGAQIHRYSTDAAGIYAFSRIDRSEKVEYIVVLNNAESEQSATFKTFQPNATFTRLYPTGGSALTSNGTADLTVTLPALSFAVYRADQPLAAATAAPAITISAPTAGQEVRDRVEVAATLDADVFAEVTFAVKVGDAPEYTVIGTDNNAPYRVFYDTTSHEPGTQLSFKAIVNNVTDDAGSSFGPLNSATVAAVVGADDTGGCAANPTYAIIHYNRPAGDYDGWGLYMWGDAIDDTEKTTWPETRPFVGEDSYGRFAFVKLKDPSQPLNFIVQKNGVKDVDKDRSFVPAQTPEVWLKQGDETIYTSRAAAQGYVTIHYQRPSGDYGSGDDYWGLHLWGDAIADGVGTDWAAPRQRTDIDDFGAYFNIPIKDATQPVNFIVHKPSGDTVPTSREPGGDRSFIPAETSDVWLLQGDATVYKSRGAAEDYVIIHYRRPAGDYGDATSTNYNDFWGMHVWTGAAQPTEWTAPLKPIGQDSFGIYFKVPLQDGATTLNYIIHRGDNKDLPEDQELDLTKYGHEVWILENTPGYLLPIVGGCAQNGDLSKTKAHWVARDTIAWTVEGGANNVYKLHYAPTGGLQLQPDGIVGGQSITLTYDPNGLSDALKAKFPHLASFGALKIAPADLDKVPQILKGQIAISASTASGSLRDATRVQIPGVLDDLFTYTGELGVTYRGTLPTLKLWAPTAKSVTLHLFDSSDSTATSTTYPMTEDAASGVWSVMGTPGWDNKFYLYEVEVFVHATGRVERNLVTDPYSYSLATNSTRSQIVNLNDPRLKPAGWDGVRKPELAAPEDIVLYELHVRDFSISDSTVAPAYRGKYKAFTQTTSNGMSHLRALAEAGLTHIHLLPVFDIATTSINEVQAQRSEPDADTLRSLPPDSEEQQRIVGQFRGNDGFNWGYDPYHYTTPEGSYATNPDGVTRIIEFREMVKALNESGLRVVMDVVYNHTSSSGQDPQSVLDRIVPGYYHRLNIETGGVETSTCCQNTATEHNMMEKLMVDSIKTWATGYKVDGFRFDLMGHHSKANLLKVRDTLQSLTPSQDGVDGSDIYIYGEGWNFGEVANDQRFVQATQLNMAGTGIGTFNDRLRDAVRGGGPFDEGENLKQQGFISGLYYDPNNYDYNGNDPNPDTSAIQKERLLLYGDQIRVGLAGNLKDYSFVSRNGTVVRGDEVPYNGQPPVGYAADPQETVNYIEAHDNETLFDALQVKVPADTTMEERVRIQNMGNSIVALTQGVPFFHAGQDMLRSKSGDGNSYDSGDWFNKLDFSYETNNWGVGLPPAWSSESDWDVFRPLLGNPALKPTKSHILQAVNHFQEMLRIRKSSRLFRLQTAEQVKQQVQYLNTGPDQIPGMLVMSISEAPGTNFDPAFKQVVVVFNANDEAQTFSADALKGLDLRLHPVQVNGSDPVVKTSAYNSTAGSFTVPARTTAVFVVQDDTRIYLPFVSRSAP